ncbi:ParB/RepB/Spo0J family partition protein [Paenibacillus agilis]|uniref:ParB/RepB/Spo0J family partition protein n=1 Tax=Paenibacillus agilis TaxID=3020863 RepID=A0A559IQA6_9BACL|nr:ParB/RepB/Spo0J family partition protein [Paenibacillus agilis]TVX89812.1 ParB/RepB/Spo0J family partition protein [Paenibacillus agilis]
MSKRLGRGLDALIPSLAVQEDDRVIEIALQQLRPNPYQPRKHFDDQAIQELAESIRQHGVIQPIIVRSVLKGYEIIAGERRFRASQLLGLEKVPAVVRAFSDEQTMEIALIENLQRENLNALELAQAYHNLMEQLSLTQEELSVKVGKSRSHIANFLRLLQLPDEVKEHVSRGTLTMGHARALAGIKDAVKMIQLTKSSISNEWSVRQLEEAIQVMNRKGKAQDKKKMAAKDPYLDELEDTLRERFRTTVKIKASKSKGKIEISYYNQQDLERLLEMLNAL